MRGLSGGRWRLRHWRLQTALAALALAFAVSLPVLLLSVGGGVSSHELANLRSTGFEVSLSAPGEHGITGAHALVEKLAGEPNIAVASPVLSVPVDLFAGTSGPVPLLVEGVVPSAFLATLPPEEAGLFPKPLPLGDPTDLVHFDHGTYAGPSAGRILISSPIAYAHGLTVGTPVRLAATPDGLGAENFTVAGIFGVPPTLLGPTAAFAALLPLSDLQVLTGYARGPSGNVIDAADTVEVALAGSAATDPGAVSRVAASLQEQYPFYAVATQSQTVQQAERAASILTGFYFALSSIGLAVGLLFLALVLVRRVEGMRSEIAVRRAIGVPAGQIARELAGSALLLAAAGVVGGMVLAYLAIAALARFGSPTVQAAVELSVYDPTTLLLLAAAVLGLGVLSSGLATRAALRIPITETLR